MSRKPTARPFRRIPKSIFKKFTTIEEVNKALRQERIQLHPNRYRNPQNKQAAETATKELVALADSRRREIRGLRVNKVQRMPSYSPLRLKNKLRLKSYLGILPIDITHKISRHLSVQNVTKVQKAIQNTGDRSLMANWIPSAQSILTKNTATKELRDLVATLSPNVHSRIAYLLESGADPDVKSQKRFTINAGKNALLAAASFGFNGIIKTLLLHGANPNIRDDSMNMTPVMWAAFEANHKSIPILARGGADLNARLKNGDTALFMAGSARVVQALIENGIDRHIRDRYGRTALMSIRDRLNGTNWRSVSIIKALSDAGVSNN